MYELPLGERYLCLTETDLVILRGLKLLTSLPWTCHRRLLIQFVKFESISVLEPHVLARSKAIQIEYEVKHLFIALFMIERNNGDSVVDLVSERVNRIVYDDHVFHASISNDSEVLYVVAFGGLNTMLTIHAILEKFFLGVDIVKDGICVDLVRCREDNHLEHFVGLLQALHEVRSKVYASTYCLFAWEVNLEKHIRVLCLDIIHAMDECLVHIEDQYFLLSVRDPRLWQVHKFVPNLLLWHHGHVVLDEMKGLKRVFKVLPV